MIISVCKDEMAKIQLDFDEFADDPRGLMYQMYLLNMKFIEAFNDAFDIPEIGKLKAQEFFDLFNHIYESEKEQVKEDNLLIFPGGKV